MKLQNRKLQNEDDAPVNTSSQASHLRDFQLQLSPPDNASIGTRPIKPMSSFDSSMALTLLFLLTVLLFLGFFSIYIPCFSRHSALETSRRRRQQQRASSNVRSLPLFVYNGMIMNDKEPIDCAICLSQFEEKETVRMIPYCGHFFHQQCIDAWFFSKISCPLCRSTQLFKLPSAKREAPFNGGVVDDREGFDGSVGGGSPERSAVGSEDTLTDMERGVLLGVRRTSSCSSFTERVALRRSSSF